MLLAAVLLLSASALAQDPFGPAHNTTPITGTWSSGTQQVVPGEGFANPAAETFFYPRTAGVGYSFSDDGWYELARFRFVANGSQPDCITSTVVWAHGLYDLLDNGSIILTPAGDGYQQVQARCNQANSNFIQNYNETELMASWRIFTDVTFGPKLHMWDASNTAVAPLFRLSDQPNMLPKMKLRNNETTVVTTTQAGLVTVQTIVSRGESKRGHAQADSPAEPRAWNFWAW